MRQGEKPLDGAREAEQISVNGTVGSLTLSAVFCVSAYPLPTMHERGAVMRMALDE